jgi:tryptophan-rich sensory protein
VRRTAAVVGGAALAGSLLTTPDSRWYRRLDLPAWQPPPWAFPVVWTTLYTTTTIASAATVSELREAEKPEEAKAFERALTANMVLNAGWSGLFFRSHRLRLAALECAALTLSGADLARRAAPGGKGRAIALGAYAGWCGFATALTTAIARRNPHSKD